MRLLCLISLIACGSPEPLRLDENPGTRGVPVGVTTLELGGTRAEVWYPATDRDAEEEPDRLDIYRWVPDNVQERLGELDLADPSTGAIRDARLRVPLEPYPVVIFSHGFGGMRLQSFDLTTHLASRGFVVISADHRGRNLADQLPCIFAPALEGCNLGFGQEDPAPPDIDAAVAWAIEANESGMFAEALDLENLGLAGHSAGGGSTAAVGGVDERFTALLPMAGGAAIEREVPTLFMSGTCDGIVEHDRVVQAKLDTEGARLITVRGAGHLAFSDLCALDLGEVARTELFPRDDVSHLVLNQLVRLATDGCPGDPPDPAPAEDCEDGYLPLEDSSAIVRYYATAFFEEQLADRGLGLREQPFDAADVE